MGNYRQIFYQIIFGTWLAPRLAEREVDRLRLRVYPEAFHHPTQKFVVELDICSRHTPILHVLHLLCASRCGTVVVLQEGVEVVLQLAPWTAHSPSNELAP